VYEISCLQHADHVLPELPTPHKILCGFSVIYVKVTIVELTHVTSLARIQTILSFISVLFSGMRIDLRKF
jgi:hypothetical protein